MSRRVRFGSFIASAVAIACVAVATAASSEAPLAIESARVTIAGTSNVHAYSASTREVRITRVQVARIDADFWARALTPGAVEAFEITIPAATLTSPKDGLDKNMHKALKVQEHADITFRLTALEPGATAGTLKARGLLRIAGVEREVVLDLTTERREASLTVKGTLHLLMTDYGIKPPTAMLGMLKTDPKVTVTFETVLGVPLT